MDKLPKRIVTDLQRMTDLSKLMMLTPEQAVALPTVVMVSADLIGCDETTVIDSCFNKPKLRNYLGNTCRAVSADIDDGQVIDDFDRYVARSL